MKYRALFAQFASFCRAFLRDFRQQIIGKYASISRIFATKTHPKLRRQIRFNSGEQRSRALIGLIFVLFVASCATTPPQGTTDVPIVTPTPSVPPQVVVPPIAPPTTTPSQPVLPANAEIYQLLFGEVGFAQLPDWNSVDVAAARRAFIRSCVRMSARPATDYLSPNAPYSGKVSDWRGACDKANDSQISDKDFWQTNFTPWRVMANEERKGRLTSYFEPIFQARLNQSATMVEPLFAKPSDLVSIELSAFDPALSGQNVVGRIENGRFVPYRSRAEITTSNARPIAWVSMGEALSLQIQGSGRLIMDDGQQYRASFAGHNGKPFGSVARELIRRGILSANQASADAISNWFKTAEPALAREVINANPRTVFFDLQRVTNPNDGPRGAQGVALEAGGSVAIDPRYHAYGIPVFIAAGAPRISSTEHSSIKRLVITQDTGGAIRGALRGDLFWGTGIEAGLAAGRVNHDADWWVLLPNGLDPVLQGAAQ